MDADRVGHQTVRPGSGAEEEGRLERSTGTQTGRGEGEGTAGVHVPHTGKATHNKLRTHRTVFGSVLLQTGRSPRVTPSSSPYRPISSGWRSSAPETTKNAAHGAHSTLIDGAASQVPVYVSQGPLWSGHRQPSPVFPRTPLLLTVEPIDHSPLELKYRSAIGKRK